MKVAVDMSLGDLLCIDEDVAVTRLIEVEVPDTATVILKWNDGDHWKLATVLLILEKKIPNGTLYLKCNNEGAPEIAAPEGHIILAACTMILSGQ